MTETVTLTLITYLVLAILIALGVYIFRKMSKVEREITQQHKPASTRREQKTAEAIPTPHPEAPGDTAGGPAEVPAHLRSEINHTMHLAEIDHSLRNIGITIRAYKRLAAMFPDVMDDLRKEETAREERRDNERGD